MEAKMMSANPPAVKLEKRATFRGTVSGLLEGSCHLFLCSDSVRKVPFS
jgi:hypothetical protein